MLLLSYTIVYTWFYKVLQRITWYYHSGTSEKHVNTLYMALFSVDIPWLWIIIINSTLNKNMVQLLVPCKHVQKHNHILLYMIVHSQHCCCCCLGAPNNRSTGREASGEQRLLHLCSGPGAISVVWGNFSPHHEFGCFLQKSTVISRTLAVIYENTHSDLFNQWL